MQDTLGKLIFKNSLIYLIYIYLLEIIVRINTNNSLIDYSMLRIFISSLILAIILGTITSFFKTMGRKIFISLSGFLLLFYSWLEINLFNYMGFFMGVGNAEQGTKITDYISDFLKASTFKTYLGVIIYILLLICVWYLFKKIKKIKLGKTLYFIFIKEKLVNKLLAILVALLALDVLVASYYFTLTVKFMQNPMQSIKNTNLIRMSDNSNLSVSQFGVFVYGLSDATITIFNIELEEDELLDDSFTKQIIEEPEEPDYERKIDDEAWNSIIANETNETYNKLNNYFINRPITIKNEKTGLFENKNLIVILLESTNEIFLNETLFPTMWKMYHEGIHFTNNYTPRNNCSTGNNEMTVMTSLFTINNTCTANTYKNNIYPEAIFNIFNKAGYSTSSYHDYAEFYYSRNIIHPNMGSGHYYNVNKLGIEWSSVYEEWPSDVDLIETAVPDFINEDKFMAFLTFVSSHQPYSVSSTLGDMYLDELKEYDYSTSLKRYLSKLIEVDKALEKLLQMLEESGKLENTVIAMFGDHYPYGLSNKDINSYLSYNVNINNEVDRTPMVIYNAGSEPIEITDYSTIIDLLPTLFNLFNLDYDPRLYFGNDIFSQSSKRSVFADGSWQDNIGYYSATSGKFIPEDETSTYTTDEIISINKEINQRQKMSALAIKNDYFNYLNKKIIKYNEEKLAKTETIDNNISEEETNE